MKICVISSYPPPPTGIATYTFKLYSALADHGVKVTVLSNKGNPRKGTVTVIRAWNENDMMYPLKLLRHVMSNDYDVIHVQHEYWLYGRGVHSVKFLILLLLLKFLRRPLVVTMHCVIPLEELTPEFFAKHGLGRLAFIKKLYVIMYNKIIHLLASKVIVHSHIARSLLINEYKFCSRKTIVIPHGADLVKCETKRVSRGKKLELRDGHMLLVFGQIRRGKGIECAINAMKRIINEIPSCFLIVAGMYNAQISPESKGYLDELKTLVRKLELDDYVKFKINISEEEVENAFSTADLAIFPYVEDEIVAASGPVLTALGFGKPIIATKLRRFMDYLDGKNAILVKPGDPNELASAVISVLRSQELKNRLSSSALRTAKSLRWKEIASKTLALYKELLNQ